MRPGLRHNRAFTLVEILIVVMILGILASIIIGLFANSSRDASVNALRDNLRTVRSSLQLYMAHHGSYPSQGSFEAQMTQFTDTTGSTSATKTGAYVYGPYIMALPMLPVGTMRGKTAITTTTYADGFGWGYDATDGTFRANLPDTELDPDGVAFNTY
jgi:general secretion pathway protein G